GFGGGNGIRFNSGASLTIENCAVRNLTGDAVQMAGNLPANTVSSFTITNTLVADNDANGIYIQPSGGGRVKVLLNRVEVYNNGAHGIAIAGDTSSAPFNTGLRGVVADSVSSNNGLSGVIASTSNSGTGVVIHVARSTITYNGTALSG